METSCIKIPQVPVIIPYSRVASQARFCDPEPQQNTQQTHPDRVVAKELQSQHNHVTISKTCRQHHEVWRSVRCRGWCLVPFAGNGSPPFQCSPSQLCFVVHRNGLTFSSPLVRRTIIKIVERIFFWKDIEYEFNWWEYFKTLNCQGRYISKLGPFYAMFLDHEGLRFFA